MQCIKGFTSPGCALQVLTKGLYFVMLSVCFQLPYAKVALHTEYMLRGITCPKGTWQHYVTTHLGSCEDIAMLYHCLLCVLFFLDTTKLLAITVISYHRVVLEFAPDIFGQTENKHVPVVLVTRWLCSLWTSQTCPWCDLCVIGANEAPACAAEKHFHGCTIATFRTGKKLAR